MNKIKDGYIWTIDFVEAHPHLTFWGGMIALIASFWF